MKENFSNLAKEIDFQEVQESHRVPKKFDPRKHTPKHSIIKLPKIKGENLKSSKRTRDSYLQRTFHKTISWLLKKNPKQTNKQKTCRQEGAGKKYLKSWKARTYIQDYSLQQSNRLEWKGPLSTSGLSPQFCFSGRSTSVVSVPP